MPKTDGHITRQNILTVAEKLFSEKGYDATSVDEISRLCHINKATVYYHFKSKTEILDSITHSILDEAKKMVNASIQTMHTNPDRNSVRSYTKALVDFLSGRRRIVSILIMESLKSQNTYNLLFKCADLIIDAQEDGVYQNLASYDPFPFKEKKEYLVHEFFTGFIPIIMYIVLEEKWAEYYACDKDKMINYFVGAFERSHMNVHNKK